MANNCLVTKLKSVVNNDALCKIDEFAFIVPKNTNNWIRIDSSSKGGQFMLFTLRSEDANVYFSNSTYSENYGKTIRSADNVYIKNSSSEDVYLILEDKWRIRKMFEYEHQDYVRLSPIFENGNFLKWLTNITYLSIHGSKIESKYIKECSSLTTVKLFNSTKTINLDDLKGLPNITQLYFWSSPLQGDISLLGSLATITSLQISYCTGTSGTLESLLEGLLTNGKTGNLDCVIYDNTNEITFHNVKTQNKHYICSFSTNSISVSVDNVVIATYNGSTWTYA